VNKNTFMTNSRFVPVNASFGGTILADPASFGGRGNFRVASGMRGQRVFSGTICLGARPAGASRSQGPPMSGQYAGNVADAGVPFQITVRSGLNRSVYRAPLRSEIRGIARRLRVRSRSIAPRRNVFTDKHRG